MFAAGAICSNQPSPAAQLLTNTASVLLVCCRLLPADKDGGPVGIVPTSREETEAQEVFTAPGMEEGVSTIPDNRA